VPGAAHFPGIDAFTAEHKLLWPTMAELRAFKTAKELALLQFICTVTSEGHMAVMQHMQVGPACVSVLDACVVSAPGLVIRGVQVGKHHEYQMESLFQHWCYYHGAWIVLLSSLPAPASWVRVLGVMPRL